jgi:hypothetical protein
VQRSSFTSGQLSTGSPIGAKLSWLFGSVSNRKTALSVVGLMNCPSRGPAMIS